jgi:hypothetical protein
MRHPGVSRDGLLGCAKIGLNLFTLRIIATISRSRLEIKVLNVFVGHLSTPTRSKNRILFILGVNLH